MARVLYISDLHCPWEHPKALYHLLKTRDRFKAYQVVCLGDEIDAASLAVKWPLNPDLPSPNDELEQAIEALQKFYNEFPHVEVCESNHGMRIFRKCRVSGIPSMVIKRYEEILKYPEGWKLNKSVEIDGVHAFHGEGQSQTSWKTAQKEFGQSVVMGHLHSGAGVIYSKNHKKQMFTANFGCLINPNSTAFNYAEHSTKKPNIGCGIVIDGEEAIFLPLS